MAAVEGLYALQNGYMGFERSGLFYGERSAERFQIPITCYIVRTSDAVVLFDTGVSPRAVPGLLRNDPLARFADEDLLVPPPRRPRPRPRRRRPGRAVASPLRPRGRGVPLPGLAAGRAEGRVCVRALSTVVLRDALLPEELRPAGLSLAPAR